MMSYYELTPLIDLLQPLCDLGVVSDADAERVTALAEQTSIADALARNYATIRDEAAAKAADALLAKDAQITPDRITKASLGVASVADVELIAAHVERAAAAQARAIVFARAGELPALLNEMFSTLTARIGELFAELRGITSATDAINSDRVSEWRELTDLKGRYAELLNLIDRLRFHELIPGPLAPSDRGPHWNHRLPTDEFEFRAAMSADDDGYRLLKYQVSLQPWVPTANEALALADEWARAA